MLNTTIDEVMYDGSKVSGIRATMKERGEEGEGMKFTTKTKKILGIHLTFLARFRSSATC
jgi:Rab GDP dissociation inhibitor